MLICSPGAPSTVTGTKMQCDSGFASVSFLLSISWYSLYAPTWDFISLTHREDNAWFLVLNDECANEHWMSNQGAVLGMPVLVETLDIVQTWYSHPKEINPLGLFVDWWEGRWFPERIFYYAQWLEARSWNLRPLKMCLPWVGCPVRLHIGLGQCMVPSLDCSKCTGHTFVNHHFDLKVTFRIP